MKHEDYSVGWVCALAVEMAAAVGMLDERHEVLPSRPNDDNIYTFGRIGYHNVVIACLPAGVVGTSSAARVASHMLSTFTQLRFAVMVGIGSGAPSKKNDIRLGDVVVGMPKGSFGGVIQYDFRKTVEDGIFRMTGSLNRPPDVLLAALSNLQAKQMMENLELGKYISDAMSRYPKMRARFEPPPIQDDFLYAADYEHEEGNDTCSQCDFSRLIAREPRSSRDPAIHYGLIASGNQVLRHGALRDILREAHDVLCFEMEAAGLMDIFPCLIIRGISDYADSHKNRHWQHYAAMTAAAYGKELICALPLYDVESSATAADVLDLDVSGTETVENSSQSSMTVIGNLDPSLIYTAAETVAHTLASDIRFKPLCTTGVLRMTPPVFRRNLAEVLANFGKAMRKNARTPLELAVAWILGDRKSHIAFQIYEEASPPQGFAAIGKQRLDQTPQDEELLRRFINDRFPTYQRKFTKEKRSEADDVDYEVQEQTEVEGEDDTLPELSTLADLHNLHQILCTGEVYWEAYKALKRVVFPSPLQQFMKVLRRHLPHDRKPQVVNCLIEWELLEYMEIESATETDLDSIFTLTGDLDCACAVRLGEYMSQRWATGTKMLDAIKALIGPLLNRNSLVDKDMELDITRSLGSEHQFRIQLQSRTELCEKEQALVMISGSLHQIVETLEQLAWLAATLRPCRGEKLTVSEISFHTQQLEVGKSFEPVFRLSLFSQTEGPEPVADEPGQCWTSLFTESILAYGFSPYRENRPEGILGLEIPFEIMASFAKVKYPILFGERIIFAGDFTLLLPEVSFADSIQWHYLHGTDRFEQAWQRFKVIDPKLRTLDLNALTKSRAFLGFCRNSEVVLGTKEFNETGILESQVPPTGPKVSLGLEGPITAGINAKGYATISAGSTWKFRGGELGQIKDEQLSLDDRLQRGRGTPALLYDDKTCRAFLVSELSAILHIVSAYLRSNSLLKERMIPYAEPSSDGGEAAYNVIHNAQDLMIPFRIGKSRKYSEIVDDFVTIFEQRKMQTCARRRELEVSLKTGLRGWDFVDLQEKTYEFFERELPTSLLARRPVWWKLFKKSGIIVLFGRNIGYPIRMAADNGQKFCNAWEEIPTGKHLLLANMISLLRLKRSSCKSADKYPGHYMITDKLAWARPIGSQLFEHCTEGGSCNPVQTICKIDTFRYWRNGNAFLRHPGEILDKGAVLFGDKPDAFAPRPCHLVRSPPPKEYSISFLVLIPVAGLILAYALFRLFPMPY